MRVDCPIITCLHLDPGYALLSVQNTLTCMELFNTLDIHRNNKINDVQFMLLLRNFTNLGRYELEVIFNLLDVDHSGEIEFEEFYLVFCILIANKDSYEKEFIYRHSATIFQLIDADASGQISSAEFSNMGVLFNFDRFAIKRIFDEFDISGDQNLDFGEFRLFTMACIDEARAQDTREKVKAFANYRKRLLEALEPTLRRYVRTDVSQERRLPRPKEIDETVNLVRCPYIPGKKDFRAPFRYAVLSYTFNEAREEIITYFREKLGKFPCLFCIVGYVLCCYCCKEDPWVYSGRKCSCKCRCNCCPCWLIFWRKMWTCCYCVFPCCHCCQPSSDKQHIARLKKTKWPSPSGSSDSSEEEEGTVLPAVVPASHSHQPHALPVPDYYGSAEEEKRSPFLRPVLNLFDTVGNALKPNKSATSLISEIPGRTPKTQKKSKPVSQPVEKPSWCRNQ